jgi:hypothetical protein
LAPVFYAKTPLAYSTQQLIQTDTVRNVPEPVNPLLRCFIVIHQEEPMATAKKKTARGRKQDRAKVASRRKYEVSYESKKIGLSASAVKKLSRRSATAESGSKNVSHARPTTVAGADLLAPVV